MLTEFLLPSRLLLNRSLAVLKMPPKRKADGKTKDDEKKVKGATDWSSLDFGSNATTGEKKVKFIMCLLFLII